MSMYEGPLWHLPQTPGTVIAIGAWWLVRLEPHEGTGPGCWELLPPRNEATRQGMERINVKAQCVYGDDWVLAEAEQEGGYFVIAAPVRSPYGPTIRNLIEPEPEGADQ